MTSTHHATTPSPKSATFALGSWALLAIVGCGPGLDLPSADDSTTAPAEEDSDSTGLDDGSSGEGETGEDSNEWCSHRIALTEISSSHRFLAIADNDGDGREELWMHDPVHGHITVFQADDSGVPVLVAEHPFDGSPRDMGDIDGDGRDDVLVIRNDQLAWIPAQAELGLASEAIVLEELRPSSESRGTWIDADGDGTVDYLENIFEPIEGSEVGGIRLHMNDGAGGLFVGGDLAPVGYELNILSTQVHASIGAPGQLLVRFQEQQALTDGPYQLQAIEVSPMGQIERLALTDEIDAQRILGVRDFDGDGMPDLSSISSLPPFHLSLAEGRADGTFEVTETIPIEDAIVHDFDGDDAERHDLLYSDSLGIHLRRGTEEGFSEPLPLRVTGIDTVVTHSWPVQIDGMGGYEVLEEVYGTDHDFALRTIGPCD